MRVGNCGPAKVFITYELDGVKKTVPIEPGAYVEVPDPDAISAKAECGTSNLWVFEGGFE